MSDETWFILGILALITIVGLIGLHIERKRGEKEWAEQIEYEKWLEEHGFKKKGT